MRLSHGWTGRLTDLLLCEVAADRVADRLDTSGQTIMQGNSPPPIWTYAVVRATMRRRSVACRPPPPAVQERRERAAKARRSCGDTLRAPSRHGINARKYPFRAFAAAHAGIRETTRPRVLFQAKSLPIGQSGCDHRFAGMRTAVASISTRKAGSASATSKCSFFFFLCSLLVRLRIARLPARPCHVLGA